MALEHQTTLTKSSKTFLSISFLFSVLVVVLRSESSVKVELKLKIISNFKIDFLKRPNGKDFKT